MSAGSGASNLGYGGTFPLSNVNGQYVNVTNSNNPANFGSNIISGSPPGPLPGLAGTKSNIDAAAGIYPGSTAAIKGGSANVLKRKIKNITKKYKMKGGSKSRKNLKNRLRHKYASRKASRRMAGGKRRKYSRRSRTQRGGYSQYQNNQPVSSTYQVAGIHLPANQLALANPAPITKLAQGGQCLDNYNHYTNIGTPSKGH